MTEKRLSRRDALRGFAAASAALGGLTLSAGRASAAARPRRAASTRANSTLGVGVIGVGIHGRAHLNGFLSNPRVRVVGVCDVDTTRREDAVRRSAEKHGAEGACRAFVDYRELLAMPGLDAVVIVTPDHWHANQVIDAARAGKHVYVEKPLSRTILEAKLMVDAVRTHGVVCQVGSQQRTEYDGRFARAVELVRSGRIGPLVSIQVGIPASKVGPSAVPCDLPEEPAETGLDWDRWLGPAPSRPYSSVLSPRGVHGHYPEWRLYREYSGGMMTDWGAHNFDIAQWGLDRDASGPFVIDPPRVVGAAYGARMVYDNGVAVEHAGANGVMFTGQKGWLFVSREALLADREDVLKPLAESETVRLPRPGGHHADWLDAIEQSRRPVCDVEVGARTVACCHLMNLAYRHGRPLRWDPASWRFIADPQADAWLDEPRRSGYELAV
jgi:predicted dehydrogenase